MIINRLTKVVKLNVKNQCHWRGKPSKLNADNYVISGDINEMGLKPKVPSKFITNKAGS